MTFFAQRLQRRNILMGRFRVLRVFAGLLLVLHISSASVSDGTLSEEKSELTVRDVYLELKHVAAKWKTLGFLLELPQDRLDALEESCTNNVDVCFQEMLLSWYVASLHPSWDIITWALNQMGQKWRAESIRPLQLTF